jgi:dTDP-4-dehydrorhamnose 3,5-epimerase-like enzyme
MAQLIEFQTFVDERGSLTVMEKELPFPPKRCFVIYDMKQPRGGHGHMQSQTILFALAGSMKIEVKRKGTAKVESDFYVLVNPKIGLWLDPEDWHAFEALTPDAVLLCIASHSYSKDDYFYEKP